MKKAFLALIFVCILWLHSKNVTTNIEKAILYGQAALELNIKTNDLEGIRAANNVLCDCALASSAALVGVEYFQKAQPHLVEQLAHLKTMPNHNAEKIIKLLARKSRPSSYKYLSSKDSQHKEESIRFLMFTQNYSRATAKKYIDNA